MSKLLLILLTAWSSVLVGCGGAYFVGFVSNPGGTNQISGTIQSVSVASAVTISGAPLTSTVVVIVNASATSTQIFCGDQSSLFPINQSVTVSFTPGVYCSTIMSVTAGSSGFQEKQSTFLFRPVLTNLTVVAA